MKYVFNPFTEELDLVQSLPGGPGTDTDAIHDNIASEISAIAEKVAPVGADILIVENSESGYVKAKILLSNFPASVIDHGLLDATSLTHDDHALYHTDGRAATWLAANHETTYTHTDIALNTTHRTSDGSNHTFIDQDVTSGSSPTFDGTNFTGIPDGALDDIYARLSGRSGSQTITGGTGVDEGIFLKGTSNASASGTQYAFYLGAGNNGTTTYPIVAYHNGAVGLGGEETAPGVGISGFETKVHVKGSGNTTATRTAFIIENTGAASAAAFNLLNNAGNGFAGQMCGSNYASGTLPNYAYFYTYGSGTIPITFATDGNTASGGPSPIIFQPGGFNVSQRSVWFTSNGRVSFNSSDTPISHLDVTSLGATEIGLIMRGAADQTADIAQWRKSDETVYSGIDATGNIFHNNSSKTYYGSGKDAGIWYDGTDMNIDPDLVGSGRLLVNGRDIKSMSLMVR